MEAGGSLNGWIVVCRIQGSSFADDIVSNDQGAGAGQFEGPDKILGVALFVCIDEDEIKWTTSFGGEVRQGIAGRPNPHFDPVGKAGTSDVEASDLGMS